MSEVFATPSSPDRVATGLNVMAGQVGEAVKIVEEMGNTVAGLADDLQAIREGNYRVNPEDYGLPGRERAV
jgi:hypothetical protein